MGLLFSKKKEKKENSNQIKSNQDALDLFSPHDSIKQSGE
jgi:hypothetical protein